MKTRWLFVSLVSLSISFTTVNAWAEGPIVKREEKQQNRIGEGVRSGQLTARETVKLGAGERKIESDREKAWSDGSLSAGEKARLMHEEDKESRKIYAMKHNERHAPGAQGSIARREENQQARIAQGIHSGQLTSGETKKLEKGEAKIERNRRQAWSDGSLSRRERRGLEHQENRQSRQIYAAKHNARRR